MFEPDELEAAKAWLAESSVRIDGGKVEAERAGFEPATQSPGTRFPVALLRPARTPLRGSPHPSLTGFANAVRGTSVRQAKQEGSCRLVGSRRNEASQQYEHIKKSAKEQGVSTDRAEEIAARTVEQGAGPLRRGPDALAHVDARHLLESPRRPTLGTNRPKGRTKEQLYNEAKNLGVEGRSKMTKAQLQRAIAGKKS